MSRHLGDFDTSAVIYGKFTTYRPSTGAAYDLAGTPALSVYKDNGTTQSTTGVTLTANFDGVTGLNHFAIDTSADGTFYSAGSFFDIVITTGTVDSVSVVGTVVGSFTLRKNSALKPTTAGRALDVSAGGEAGIDWANIGSPTTTVNLSGTSTLALQPTTAGRTIDVASTGEVGLDFSNVYLPDGPTIALGIVERGTAQSVTSTTLVGRAAATNDSIKAGMTILAYGSTQGYWQSVVIDSVSGDTFTIAAWPITTPSGTITYHILGTPQSSSTVPVDARVVSMNTDVITGTAVAASAVTEIQNGLATQASVDVIDDFLDTEIAAIKAKTDSLTFTQSGHVDANVQRINDVIITGDGSAGDKFDVV